MIPAVALVAGVMQLAPMLSKLFGGSKTTEEAAELAAKVARTVTGTESNDAALEALKSNPSLVLEYQNELLKHETSFEELYIADKKDARARDVEFLKAGTRNHRGDFLVAITVLVIFTVMSTVTFATELNEYAKGALTTILGVFLNQLTNVFSFEFGTTRKTEDKQTQILNDYIKM